jgi:hypothetical protein
MQRVTRSRRYASLVLGALFAGTMALGACGEVAEEPGEAPEVEEELEDGGLEMDPVEEGEEPDPEDVEPEEEGDL